MKRILAFSAILILALLILCVDINTEYQLIEHENISTEAKQYAPR